MNSEDMKELLDLFKQFVLATESRCCDPVVQASSKYKEIWLPKTRRGHTLIEELEKTISATNEHEYKWRLYEREYILPCFLWAKERGIDLHKLVEENPGKNCVKLLVEALSAGYSAERALAKYESTLKDAMSNEAKARELALSTFQRIENICGWTKLSQTAREDCIKLLEKAVISASEKLELENECTGDQDCKHECPAPEERVEIWFDDSPMQGSNRATIYRGTI